MIMLDIVLNIMIFVFDIIF